MTEDIRSRDIHISPKDTIHEEILTESTIDKHDNVSPMNNRYNEERLKHAKTSLEKKEYFDSGKKSIIVRGKTKRKLSPSKQSSVQSP